MEQNQATQYLAQGFVWAESVLLAVCQHYDIETDNDIIPRIGYYFAGGLGNTGAVCGAVVGAAMAMGVRLGRPETMDEGLGKLALAGEFRRRFEAAMGSISCRDLTGVDLNTEEGIEQYMSSDIPGRVCFPAVATAYRLVVDLIDENS